MTTVIGVSFKRAGKMYYFDPNGLELHTGDQVIVETARGMECGDAAVPLSRPRGKNPDHQCAPAV